jgi:hypothetical protein
VTEHGWPGWPDDGHLPEEHHDPHGADHLGGADLPPEADPPVWTADEHWASEEQWAPGDAPDPLPQQEAPAEQEALPEHEPLVAHDAAGYDDALSPYPDGGGHGLLGPVGVDPDAVGDLAADPVFPPGLNIDLPEPVDGFPWIDTGTLGMVAVDPTALDSAATDGAALDSAALEATVGSAELAAYAATELPPAVDPWAALAASDDPATSALATFWKPED